MFCSLDTNSVKCEDLPAVKDHVENYRLKARNAQITFIALGSITLFLMASSFILFGLGTYSPTFLMGLGMFPYLAGALLSYVGLGILCGAFIFAAIATVRTCQKEQWQAIWNRLENKV